MITTGLLLLIVSEVIDYTMRAGMGDITSGEMTPSDIRSRIHDFLDSLWLISKVTRYLGTAFVVGLVILILGYARLFLDKQTVFEQYVQAQLNVLAHGDVEATQGATYRGDRTKISGDVIASAVGMGAALRAHDITVYKQMLEKTPTLDPKVKQVLAAASEEINRLQIPEEDKNATVNDLRKLTVELTKHAPEQSRVAGYLARISDVAPTVEQILTSHEQILTGKRMEALRDALCAAFDQESFDQMLRMRLEKRDLVPPGAFRTVVFRVIDIASRENWIPALVRAAITWNPRNFVLKKFCEENPDLVSRTDGR
jgi:hypothetical protein